MKPASVISLIVAVLLVIAGFVTCMIAKNMAEAEGQPLFAEDRDYGLVNTIDLSETSISKLELNVNDVEIRIVGKSDTSYMELVNFRENRYSFSDSNRVLTFDEVGDVTSMLKFWENGMSFKGIRYLFTAGGEEPEGDKVINLYLGGDGVDLKIVNITGQNCQVYLENLDYNADYTIALETGELSCSNLRTQSNLSYTGTTLGLQLDVASFGTAEIQCTDLTVNGFRAGLPLVDITCDTIQMDLTPNMTVSSITYNIALESGSVTVNDNMLGTGFQQATPTPTRFNLTAKEGEIVLKNPPSQAEITGGASAAPAN